jgi:hypothetical protein
MLIVKFTKCYISQEQKLNGTFTESFLPAEKGTNVLHYASLEIEGYC